MVKFLIPIFAAVLVAGPAAAQPGQTEPGVSITTVVESTSGGNHLLTACGYLKVPPGWGMVDMYTAVYVEGEVLPRIFYEGNTWFGEEGGSYMYTRFGECPPPNKNCVLVTRMTIQNAAGDSQTLSSDEAFYTTNPAPGP